MQYFNMGNFVIILTLAFCFINAIVCHNISYPFVIKLPPQDPDSIRTTCEIIIARGFNCEIHHVLTHQGYIVELHRIPNSNRKPVILQPGLLGTSADFIMASEHVYKDPAVIGHNMGLELFKQGFDVWLSNNRGSVYGMNHVELTPNDPEFWRFSFDQISQFDIPAIIDYVRVLTGFDKINYIGNSQGSAVMFALLSQSDLFNKKIDKFIAISPITRIGFATTSLRAMITILKPILKFGGPVFARDYFRTTLIPFGCALPIGSGFCEGLMSLFTGPDYSQMNSTRLLVYLSKMPTSTSAQNLLHYHQLFNTNRFQMFDFGFYRNWHIYDQLSPPIYPLSNITHPNIHIIYGKNDWFLPSSAVAALRKDLSGCAAKFYQLSNSLSNHIDPLVGIDVAVEVNQRIISILKQFY